MVKAALICVLAIPGPTQAAEVLTNSIGMKLTRIPAGKFMMGTPEAESRAMLERMREKKVHEWYRQSPPSESPPRLVTISRSFLLGTFEVTVSQFRCFAEASGYTTDAEKDGKGADGKRDGKWTTGAEFSWRNMGYERNPDEPVVNVTWRDAKAFCEWLSKRENRTYRLPTEAEWEYACRAGSTNEFYWGSDESKRDEYVWHERNAGGKPHRVGTLKPNAFGLFDMSGNVYEYCRDWFTTNTPTANLVTDPQGPANGVERVVRSGSWGTDPIHCRSAFRGGAGESHRNMRDGFRVLLEVPQ